MSEPTAAGRARGHWFYDNKPLIAVFCLLSFVAILWQVSRFEGFRPIFTCASEKDVDRGLLAMGMEACMGAAHSHVSEARCMQTAYLLACTKEKWR